MKYSSFTIDLIKAELADVATRSGTPKKYSVLLYQAFEVIRQLQRAGTQAGREDEDGTD